MIENFNKEKAVSFSGHRILKKDFSLESLREKIQEKVDQGFEFFLVGMALGFDTLCFKVLQELKEKNLEKTIKIIACVPCPEQDKYFSKYQKEDYKQMLSSADYVFTISPRYDDNCMKRRNVFMLDNSSVLITYLNATYGGTYFTVKTAVEKNLKIEYIN